MCHIGGDGRAAVRGGEVGKGRWRRAAGGDLRLQIGDVERRVARRQVACSQMPCTAASRKRSSSDDRSDVVEDDAFFLDIAVARRYRSAIPPRSARLAARRDEKGGGIEVVIDEHRRGDDGDVGQMGAASSGALSA